MILEADIMRKKILYLFITISILFVCVFTQIGFSDFHNRYIQHEKAVPPDPVTAGSEEEFYTHLPLISIDTHGKEIAGNKREDTSKTACTIQIWDQDGVYHKFDEIPAVMTNAEINIRGNSSRLFDKKGYKIHLYDENWIKKDISFDGMAENDEWILNGPFLDKTLLRNYLCYNLAGQVMDYAPNVRYCEVFINGEYEGVYLFIEPIERAKTKVNITGINPFLNTTGYILQLDTVYHTRTGDLNNYTHYSYELPTSRSFVITYPGKTKLTPELTDYIEKDISKIEKALYSYDYDDPFYGYRAKMDVNNFIDYFIINEFSMNSDSFRKSTYLYKSSGGKLKTCVWDFNNAFDNYIDIDESGDGFSLPKHPYYVMLLRDKKFVDLLINRYRELRKTILSEAYINQFIDDTVEYLGPAIDRNYERWGYSYDVSKVDGNNKLFPDERNPKNYEEAVVMLKNTIHARIEWMDNHIDTLYQYCADSANINYDN